MKKILKISVCLVLGILVFLYIAGTVFEEGYNYEEGSQTIALNNHYNLGDCNSYDSYDDYDDCNSYDYCEDYNDCNSCGYDEDYNDCNSCGYDEDYNDCNGYDNCRSYNDYDSDDTYYDDDDRDNYGTYTKSNSDYPHGSAGKLQGTTILISIFVNDTDGCSWKNAKAGIENEILGQMKIATNWLTKKANKYGSKANFIYDWTKNKDIYYKTSIKGSFLDESMDALEACDQYVRKNIDWIGLKKKYKADNVVFIYQINSPKSNGSTSYTIRSDEEENVLYESCFMFTYTLDERETPAGYAHEIMHAFGARDLYYTESTLDSLELPTRYIDYLERQNSNDIMRTTYDVNTDEAYYDHISNEMGWIDAYYMGIAKRPKEADKWGLGKSEFE